MVVRNMKLTDSAIDLMRQRYCSHGEKPNDVFPRVAKAVASQMNSDPDAKQFLKIMEDLDFLPNSPCLRNAGYSNQVKACLTKDTVIHCAHGDYTIRDLMDYDGELYVFSRDIHNGIRCAKATKPILSRKNAQVMKIVLDTGQSIKCTKDHLIMMRDGTYKEAGKIQLEDSLMPFTYHRDKSGHRQILNDNYKWIPGYRIVQEDINGIPEVDDNKKYDIHHIDGNGNNDYPTNLKFMEHGEHASLHMQGNKLGAFKRSDEIKQRMSEAQKKRYEGNPMTDETKEKLSKAQQHRFENPEEREKISKLTREAMWNPEIRKRYLKGMKKAHNHKVVMTEDCPNEDVYDIEIVEKYHNFAANGIFVHNCFVLPIDDSMESIFKTLQQSALIFKSGGGVGYNFSNLRERGAELSHGGTSSGVVSFMKLYNSLTETVKQGGFRRGASMGVLNIDHPEILNFIKEKVTPGSMNNFNLSVMVNDEFMDKADNGGKVYLRSRLDRRVIKGNFRCRDLFNIMTYSAWLTGDPGLLFYDRINKDNVNYPKHPIEATNPCGEVPLLPYESCCLGSINLSNFVTKDGEFDKDRFSDIVRISTKFLIGMNKICKFPIDECYKAQYEWQRLGLGVMGFADMLMKMGIIYDSDDSLKMIDIIGKIMKESKKYAPMSVATLSIAPTGSLSIIADCSSGIEPWFAKSYTRHLTVGKVSESRVSKYLRTAHEVTPEWHLKVQARWQEYIDNGVSKTINLPHSATIQDIAEIYMSAWKMGCKGITIFRDGCLGDTGQVLRTTCEDENCYL